jgi:hypothetical protein
MGIIPGNGDELFRHLLSDSLAARFWIVIRFGVHRIGGMDGAEGIVDCFVGFILGYASNVRSREPTVVPRLIGTPYTELFIHWAYLLEIKMRSPRIALE